MTDRLRQDVVAETLAWILNVPFVIVDATALTEAGTSARTSRHPLKLIQAADSDVKKVKTGSSTSTRSTSRAQSRQPVDHP